MHLNNQILPTISTPKRVICHNKHSKKPKHFKENDIKEDPLIFSSYSVSSCDVEVIESLFCLRVSPVHHHQQQQPNVHHSNSIKFINDDTIPPTTKSGDSKPLNWIQCDGKRKRCETTDTTTTGIEEEGAAVLSNIVPRKNIKQCLLDSYFEKVKQVAHLSEDQVYSELFNGFHSIKQEVSNIIATKETARLLSMCNYCQPIRTNLLRMIHSIYSNDQKDAIVRLGRDLVRFPILALVVTSVRPFRNLKSSNDMERLAKSIGLKESNNFNKVLQQKLSITTTSNETIVFSSSALPKKSPRPRKTTQKVSFRQQQQQPVSHKSRSRSAMSKNPSSCTTATNATNSRLDTVVHNNNNNNIIINNENCLPQQASSTSTSSTTTTNEILPYCHWLLNLLNNPCV